MPNAARSLPWWRRELFGPADPWVRAVEVSVLVVFAVLLLGGLLPRSVMAPIERTLGPRLPAPLEAYPDVESLGKVAREQLAGPKPGDPRLLMASRSFRGDTNGWAFLSIATDGRLGSGRDLWNYARQGGGLSPYMGASFDPRAVQALLDRLGPSVSPPPPIARALFVSFGRGGVWTTRVYDCGSPPVELVRAERLAGTWAAPSLPQNYGLSWFERGASLVPAR